MDGRRIILIGYLTLILGTFTWSTQLTKSITVPKVVTKKYNMAYICSKHAQDQYCILSFESLAPVLQKSDYYHLIIGQMTYFIPDGKCLVLLEQSNVAGV